MKSVRFPPREPCCLENETCFEHTGILWDVGVFGRAKAPEVDEAWSNLLDREEALLALIEQNAANDAALGEHESAMEHEGQHLGDIRKSANTTRDEISSLEGELKRIQAELALERKRLTQLGDDEAESLKRLEEGKERAATIMQEKQALSDAFEEERGHLEQDGKALEKAAIAARKKRKGPALPIQSVAPKTAIDLHALGDVHGWAPGLIGWWRAEGLHNVTIDGHNLGETEALLRLFQNPLARLESGRDLIPCGLDGHPWRSKSVVSMMHGLSVTAASTEQHAVLLGDLVDRGDHGELVLELVRQSLLCAPGRRWVLLGNHEQLLLEGDKDRWTKEEQRWMFGGEGRHVGTVYLQPYLQGTSDLQAAMDVQFRILRSQMGALLMAQHTSLLKGLEGPALEAYLEAVQPVFDAAEGPWASMAKHQKSGAWPLHEASEAFLNALVSLSFTEEVVVPGTLMAMMIDGTLMMHGEPTGLEHLSDHHIDDLSKSGGAQNISVALARMRNGRLHDAPLLHARGYWSGAGTEETKVNRLALPDAFTSVFPSVTEVLHGHTPSSISKSKVDGSGITVQALDLGMTPIYHYDFGGVETALDPTRTPESYQRRLSLDS